MNDSLFSAEELAAARAAAEEAQREFDTWERWLKSAEGKAWGAEQVLEARKIAEEFARDVAAGKYALSDDDLEQLRRDAEAFAEEVRAGKFALSPSELEQLRRDGVLVKEFPSVTP